MPTARSSGCTSRRACWTTPTRRAAPAQGVPPGAARHPVAAVHPRPPCMHPSWYMHPSIPACISSVSPTARRAARHSIRPRCQLPAWLDVGAAARAPYTGAAARPPDANVCSCRCARPLRRRPGARAEDVRRRAVLLRRQRHAHDWRCAQGHEHGRFLGCARAPADMTRTTLVHPCSPADVG